MQPQSLLGQVTSSMASGQSPLNQISSSSPASQPGLMPPPQTPMPGNDYSVIHKAAASRGMDLSGHPQLQPGQSQQSQGQDVTLPIQDNNPQQPGVQVPASEAELIIKALTGRMKTISGHEEKIRDAALSMIQPQADTPQAGA